MQSITDKGLFDYATGKYTAPRFENYVTGEVTTAVPSSDVIVHEGTTDPILSDNPSDPPRTYVQFARIGLGMQKSQIGPNVRVPPAGVFDVAYHRYGSKLANQPAHETSFFDGIDTSILGLQDYLTFPTGIVPALSGMIHDAGRKFDPAHPNTIAPLLADAMKKCDELIGFTEKSKASELEKVNALHELRIKLVQLNNALALSLELGFDATTRSTASADVGPGAEVTVHGSLTTSSPSSLQLMEENLEAAPAAIAKDTVYRSPVMFGDTFLTSMEPEDHDLIFDMERHPATTRPYFGRANIEQPFYEVKDRNLRNAPITPAALIAWAKLNYNGISLQIGHVVHSGSQPIMFAPTGSLSLSAHAQVLPSAAPSTLVSTFLYPIEHPATEPKLSLPAGWKSHMAISDVTAPGEMCISVEAPRSSRTTEVVKASAILHDGSKITEGYRPIGYGDLPRTNYSTPATVRIVPVDLNLPTTHRIAYLPGTGDAVPEALASINIEPDTLTVADLTPAKLAQYDTVILGVRTYAAHPDLHGAPTQALLDYARNGGNVLVQYQTAEFTAADAPYPLTLGYAAEKVVDETDPVQLLPDKNGASAPFLTTPNKITPADFDNWVEERGHGFLGSWDSHYTALTETHDPDQDPQRGGLITTPLGKGRWTYCAFALYRQLPEAVPGAFRLFVNLLSAAPLK
jgi:hypothetical protein